MSVTMVDPARAGGALMALFAVAELLMRQGAAAKSVRPQATDRGSSALILAAYVLAVVAITTHLLPSPVAIPVAVAWAGAAVGAAGFVFRLWSMRVLGRFYTRTLLTTADQRVVKEGPYRWVRHPGYLGSILVWLGAALASGNVVSVAAVAVLLAVAYAFRIRAEEAMLVVALGPPYEEYRRGSWRLLPFVY